ncbi:uncharacterized protein SPPG_01922 [Spizellomyces punctatus DAOM BR117]|uniref:Homeobox domain-containing protein n=1 Tax=Spizellomyces punctatus (strain DAOM BR117) TaxID=645134 RepID=A0A0L0HP21_SPIPD|nr:uncharacterized protein SPPG_01922 [Spizellomyces punctatus DAOM BR117]KND02842.1 hypothetical protein SPPG_01922 [Spizellomyces punctatus DAOM BR117]|eukprot:XP_016610881.1 hypothetical protein SPPG_01922 [Spizellomyces punctatus DAOM BR117]
MEIVEAEEHPLFPVADRLLTLRDTAINSLTPDDIPERLDLVTNLLKANKRHIDRSRRSRDSLDHFILSVIAVASRQQIALYRSIAQNDNDFERTLDRLCDEMDTFFVNSDLKRKRTSPLSRRSKSVESSSLTEFHDTEGLPVKGLGTQEEPEARGRQMEGSSGQQRSVSESGRPKRPNHPPWKTQILFQWYYQHRANPYPSEAEKEELCNETELNAKQLNDWFINARRRYRIPRQGTMDATS